MTDTPEAVDQAARAAYATYCAMDPVESREPDWGRNGYKVEAGVWQAIAAAALRAKPVESKHPTASSRVVEPGFQSEVGEWMLACFNEKIAADQLERADRFTEEALELAQTMPGFSKERAHALVDYVFDRAQGEVNQEVGGVMVTLAALCNTTNTSIREAAETELARVWTKVEQIRVKQAAKPTGSALPVATLTPSTDRDRDCTCHPDDNPPRPCPRKYALSDCIAAASTERDSVLEALARTQWMLETIDRTHSINFAEVSERIIANRAALKVKPTTDGEA